MYRPANLGSPKIGTPNTTHNINVLMYFLAILQDIFSGGGGADFEI